MKRFLIFMAILVLFVGGATAWSKFRTSRNGAAPVSTGRIPVVVSIYPLQAFVQAVGGDLVDATAIVPSGTEPHDYEPSPDEIAKTYRARLFVWNGAGVDPWAQRIQGDLAGRGTETLGMTGFFELRPSVGQGGDAATDTCLDDTTGANPECDRKADAVPGDPHIWLDPVKASRETELIRDALVRIDPDHKGTYTANAARYVGILDALDTRYAEGLARCDKHEIVVSHNAYGYLADRYGFGVLSLTGIDPEAEPSLRTVADIVDKMKADDIRYVFSEPLESPKSVQTVADETGATVSTLFPIENLSDASRAAGEDYVSLMERNLENLRQALECH